MDRSAKVIAALCYVAGALSAVIAFLLFVGHSGTQATGITFWSTAPKCDNHAPVETVKDLANQKLSTFTRLTVDPYDILLRRGGSAADREAIRRMDLARLPLVLDADSFRERGAIGKGVSCAAVLYVMLGGRRTFNFSSEYSVEPTSDGKTIVTARFQPN